MQNIFAIFKESLKILTELIRVDLRSLRICSFFHRLIELLKRNRLTQIIAVRLSVQFEMKTYVRNLSFFKMFFR